MSPAHFKKGLSIIEVIVGVSILLLAFLGLVTGYNRFIRASFNTVPTIKASYLLEEGAEALKILRDTSWSAKIAPLSTATTYALDFSTTTAIWSATTTNTSIDTIFYRTFTVTNLNRDANSDISTSTGTYDANIKLITLSVAWKDRAATTTRQMSFFLANLFSN